MPRTAADARSAAERVELRRLEGLPAARPAARRVEVDVPRLDRRPGCGSREGAAAARQRPSPPAGARSRRRVAARSRRRRRRRRRCARRACAGSRRWRRERATTRASRSAAAGSPCLHPRRPASVGGSNARSERAAASGSAASRIARTTATPAAPEATTESIVRGVDAADREPRDAQRVACGLHELETAGLRLRLRRRAEDRADAEVVRVARELADRRRRQADEPLLADGAAGVLRATRRPGPRGRRRRPHARRGRAGRSGRRARRAPRTRAETARRRGARSSSDSSLSRSWTMSVPPRSAASRSADGSSPCGRASRMR